nr:unnamed protein product [Spirometra erinaceieuropaei]
MLAEQTRRQDVLADRLYQAYSQLSSLPVPSLLRPICQLLGLRWLGKGDQRQAARFLSQSVPLAASSLYASILCSKINWALLSGHTPGNRLDRRAKPVYCGLRWMDGRMKHCAGIVETRLCLVRLWKTAAGTGLRIALAETRLPSPTETADSRHMRSSSTTNIKVVAP